MYAVIESGGKQHRVSPGDVIKLETLDIEPGAAVEFDQVLLLANDEDIKIGAPYLEGTKVTGEVISNGRHKKINILKFKRRKHHMKQMGHRHDFGGIKAPEKSPKKAAPKTPQTTAKPDSEAVTFATEPTETSEE